MVLAARAARAGALAAALGLPALPSRAAFSDKDAGTCGA